ncbi:hypothetical protein ON010_g3832 [Phytophthora cinnamomi]|nr:hypothetical protein ON010_g3832 [Phytophthora cinnamomi]
MIMKDVQQQTGPMPAPTTVSARVATSVETSTEEIETSAAITARVALVNMDRALHSEGSVTRLTTATVAANYLTETGLVPIGLPQLAEPAIDTDCVYAFVGKCKWTNNDKEYVNTMENGKERGGNLGGGEMSDANDEDEDGSGTEAWVSSAVPVGRTSPKLGGVLKLLPGERLGWWSAWKFDHRARMRALARGAVNDVRTRVLLDTGANVSVISERFAKKLWLREIQGHGRCMEIQGFTKGTMATARRTLVKVTLGWERVYEFELWIMDHGAGVDVVLGTDFMIPAGVRLDMFHATAKLPGEVSIPLIKTKNMLDERSLGPHINSVPAEDLLIPDHECVDWASSRSAARGA